MGGHSKQHLRGGNGGAKGGGQHGKHHRLLHDAKKTKLVKDPGVPKLATVAEKLMHTASRHSHSIVNLHHQQSSTSERMPVSRWSNAHNSTRNNNTDNSYTEEELTRKENLKLMEREYKEEEQEEYEFWSEQQQQTKVTCGNNLQGNMFYNEESNNDMVNESNDLEQLAEKRREMTTLALKSSEKLHSYEAPIRLFYGDMSANNSSNNSKGSNNSNTNICTVDEERFYEYEKGKNKKCNAANQRSSESSFRRFFKQFQKVVESCDVLLQVLDARDPLGCRLTQLEQSIRSDYGEERKKIVLILNKVDLLPSEEVVQAWIRYFNEVEHIMCVPFAATAKGVHGQNYVTNLFRALRGLARNSENNERKAIVVGVIGYPNVGKSSIINALKRKNVVGVGNTPGFTTGLTEVELRSDIRVLDCPGVVSPHEEGGDVVLRNAVKVSELVDVFEPVQRLLQRCTAVTSIADTKDKKYNYDNNNNNNEKKMNSSLNTSKNIDTVVSEDISAQHTFHTSGVHPLAVYYNIPAFDPTDVFDFIRKVGIRRGRLGKGGVVDEEATARMILNDWNDGRIVYYTYPPTTEEFANGGFSVDSTIPAFLNDGSNTVYNLNNTHDYSENKLWTSGSKSIVAAVEEESIEANNMNRLVDEQRDSRQCDKQILEPRIVPEMSRALTFDGLPTFYLSIKGIEQGRERKFAKLQSEISSKS